MHMRKYGKFLLLVAAAALAAMAIGAASAPAASVNNPGSHSVDTATLMFTSGIGQLHCNVSMTFYVSSNTEMIVTGWTPTNCTPIGTVYTPSNVPVSDANGNPPASPWETAPGVWKDWSGKIDSGGPNDWSGTLHGVQYQMVSSGLTCSYKGDMNVTYHNNGVGDADGTFTASGTLPRVSGSFLCGNTVTLSTTDTTVSPNTQNPFAFSAGDAGFTIS
jgi:hypothetical protein